MFHFMKHRSVKGPPTFIEKHKELFYVIYAVGWHHYSHQPFRIL